MPGSGPKVCVGGGGGSGGVRTKFSIQLWSQAEQKLYKNGGPVLILIPAG